ncbi:hypothetical protein LTR08_005381 [Meristemomyces frigidus]|nr:hypothetical protein LTR08_005381 [Meristemomyces frigidus]
MSPARLEDDDPVTAEYSIYLTPPHPTQQIYLLQYPNRVRNRPYNLRQGAAPDTIRIKPASGHLELDVNLNTTHNFNRYQGLKWGDALQTGREVQNASATFGMAAGLSGMKPRSAGRVQVKDRADREGGIMDGLHDFARAEGEGGVMHKQALGGQITRHDGVEEAGKPVYFVGAFRGQELHLTKVDGTVQMRPQFHHLDAEEQRTRLASSRANAAAEGAEAAPKQQGDARSLLMKNKAVEEGSKDRLEDRTRRILLAAEAEEWVQLEYVDEDQEESYEMFRDTMFVRDVAGAVGLRSGMGNEEFLDAISAPRRDGPTRRRKRAPRRRGVVGGEGEGEDEDEEMGEAGAEGSGGE